MWMLSTFSREMQQWGSRAEHAACRTIRHHSFATQLVKERIALVRPHGLKMLSLGSPLARHPTCKKTNVHTIYESFIINLSWVLVLASTRDMLRRSRQRRRRCCVCSEKCLMPRDCNEFPYLLSTYVVNKFSSQRHVQDAYVRNILSVGCGLCVFVCMCIESHSQRIRGFFCLDLFNLRC